MHKFLFILFCGCLFSATCFAQDSKYVYEDSTLQQPAVTTENDTVYTEKPYTEIVEAPSKEADDKTDTILFFNKLNMSADSIQIWKNDKAFRYAGNLDSLLMEMKKKKDRKIEQPVQRGPSFFDSMVASPVTRVIFWVLAGIFVLFIIYKLFLADGIFKRTTAAKDNVVPLVEEEIITPESDFDSFIRLALAAGNYRLAIRYQYLKTLHLLAAKNWVQLAADKTNYQYVREINNYDYQNGFSQLTLNYEYVWYGEFAIEESIYMKLHREFSDFNAKI